MSAKTRVFVYYAKDTLQRALPTSNTYLPFCMERVKIGTNCTLYFGHLALFWGLFEAYYSRICAIMVTRKFLFLVSFGPPPSYQTTSTGGKYDTSRGMVGVAE